MKMFNSYHTLILLAIALVLAFAVPLKAQDGPQDFLNAHNRVRAAVGVQPLTWHEDVATYARAYARLRRDCRLIGSGGGYGENLAVSSRNMSAAEAVSLWVSEGPDYFYATNTCRVGRRCDSYTQVVSKHSVWLGCAKVRCDNGGTFIICNYDPPGNVRGRWPF